MVKKKITEIEELEKKVQERDKEIKKIIYNKRDAYFSNIFVGTIGGIISGLILSCSQFVTKDNFIGFIWTTIIAAMIMLFLIKGIWSIFVKRY